MKGRDSRPQVEWRLGLSSYFGPVPVFGGAFGVTVETPGGAVNGDAVPDAAFFTGRHFCPQLNFFEAAATAFAGFVALAGRANGDAGCVGGA